MVPVGVLALAEENSTTEPLEAQLHKAAMSYFKNKS